MITTLSRQAGRRYPQISGLPGVPVGSLPATGSAPEPSLVTSLSGASGMRPLLSGMVGMRPLLAGNTGVK